jgi:serine/threonine protein kinase
MSQIPPCPNVVQLFGICRTPFCLLTEYIDGGSLYAYLAQPVEISLVNAMIFTRDICVGLEHLHRNGFVHR